MDRVLPRRGPPLVVPFPLQNLVARAIDDHSVALTWINNDSADTHFRIERMEDDGVRFQTILDHVPSTSVTDESGSAGVTYLYQVRALLDGEPSEAASNIASAVLLSCPSKRPFARRSRRKSP